MAVTVYTSTDGSAPVLNGTAGEYVNLLDKCLVAGYGAKSAAGWTKPFTGTNKASFRQGGGNQYYLRVEDNFSSGSIRYAKCRGYVTMSDVDTGTEPFPTTAQVTDGIEPQYNNGLVSRPWIVVADNRTVYAFVDPGANGFYFALAFGDFYSYVGSDSYRTIIIGSTDISTDRLSLFESAVTTVGTGKYVPRKYSGTGTSLAVGTHGDTVVAGTATPTKGTILYPDPVSGGLFLAPIYIHEIAEPTIRGRLRGLWHWAHVTSGIGDRDTFSGTPGSEFDGKTFLIVALGQSTGVFVIETSDTWQTN